MLTMVNSGLKLKDPDPPRSWSTQGILLPQKLRLCCLCQRLGILNYKCQEMANFFENCNQPESTRMYKLIDLIERNLGRFICPDLSKTSRRVKWTQTQDLLYFCCDLFCHICSALPSDDNSDLLQPLVVGTIRCRRLLGESGLLIRTGGYLYCTRDTWCCFCWTWSFFVDEASRWLLKW